MNTFDEIIQTKAYSDLTSGELEVIRELVSSEEEYNEMKAFYSGIDQLAISNREEVSLSVKTSLNSVFQAKHPGISQNWSAAAEVEEKKIIPLYNRTLFRVAALLVLSAGAATIWFALPENQLVSKEQAKLTASSDSAFQEENKEAEPKKKFPINESDSREFTAASTVPADEISDQQKEQTFTVTSRAADGKWATLKTVTPSPGTYTFQSTGAATYYSTSGNTAYEKAKDQAESSTVAGMNADLHPEGKMEKYGEAEMSNAGVSTNDLLSLIEPSF